MGADNKSATFAEVVRNEVAKVKPATSHADLGTATDAAEAVARASGTVEASQKTTPTPNANSSDEATQRLKELEAIIIGLEKLPKDEGVAALIQLRKAEKEQLRRDKLAAKSIGAQLKAASIARAKAEKRQATAVEKQTNLRVLLEVATAEVNTTRDELRKLTIEVQQLELRYQAELESGLAEETGSPEGSSSSSRSPSQWAHGFAASLTGEHKSQFLEWYATTVKTHPIQFIIADADMQNEEEPNDTMVAEALNAALPETPPAKKPIYETPKASLEDVGGYKPDRGGSRTIRADPYTLAQSAESRAAAPTPVQTPIALTQPSAGSSSDASLSQGLGECVDLTGNAEL